MAQLTGPPRLAGIVRGYASADGPLLDEWEDRSTYLEGRVRTRRKGPARLWPTWSLTVVCSPAEWLAWRSDLRGDPETGEFDWSPRTRMPGDPAWLAEHVYRARVRGGLSTLAPLRTRDTRTGEVVYVVELVVEGVEPYAAEPDRVEGGYYLVAEDVDSVTLEGYGSGTVGDGPVQVVTWPGTSDTYTIETALPGDDATAAVRTTDLGNGSVRVDTIPAPQQP